MKPILLLLICWCCCFAVQEQPTDSINIKKINPKIPTQQVTAACGHCQFGLTGKGCNLAIKLDGKVYLVDGTSIDDHGDAHADDGFCNAIRKATIQGKVVGDRYKVSYFKLKAVKKKQ
jgi:hypothetical protein